MILQKSLLLILTISISLISCKQKKSFNDGFMENIQSSTSKTFEKALKNPEKISSLVVNDKEIEVIPKELDGRFINLIQLGLHENKIKVIPNTLGKIERLESLHLENNQITEVPNSVCNLKYLRLFSAYSNQITKLPDAPIMFHPQATIDLRWNKIEVLPPELFSSNFQNLWLHGNPIKELPKEIGNKKDLITLWIADTEIEDIPESFYELKNLKHLDIRNTKIPEKTVKKLREKLPECDIMADY